VPRGDFQQMASEALDEVPAAFQRYLSNTLIVVEDRPSLEAVSQGTDPDLLGLYEGGTALEHGMPEHIVLYQQNHENICADRKALRAEVRETILHEIGHHFGMEEGELPF
jgi:predicted Zn-dependent protease with MMP-like domain